MLVASESDFFTDAKPTQASDVTGKTVRPTANRPQTGGIVGALDAGFNRDWQN